MRKKFTLAVKSVVMLGYGLEMTKLNVVPAFGCNAGRSFVFPIARRADSPTAFSVLTALNHCLPSVQNFQQCRLGFLLDCQRFSQVFLCFYKFHPLGFLRRLIRRQCRFDIVR